MREDGRGLMTAATLSRCSTPHATQTLPTFGLANHYRFRHLLPNCHAAHGDDDDNKSWRLPLTPLNRETITDQGGHSDDRRGMMEQEAGRCDKRSVLLVRVQR